MKYIAILILISCSMDLMAQYADTKPRKIRVTDHRSNTSHNRFIIDSMRMAIHDGRILKSQLNQGIIGNDFYSDFEIGVAQADNNRGNCPDHTPTDYQPIDGYKRTLTGKLIEFRFNEARQGPNISECLDDDLNFIIEVDSNHTLFQSHKSMLRNRNIPRSQQPYRNWNVVFGEIDIFDNWHKFYSPPFSMPKKDDLVSLHGPWVVEVFDPGEFGSHDDFHEIHPAEQIWWKSETRNSKIYNLILANDASKRFNDRGDFTEWGNTKLKNFWVNTPHNGVFAINFKVNPRYQTVSFIINHIAESGVRQTNDEPHLHYLIHKSDTLVKIQENGKKCVNIEFENVGFDPATWYETDKKEVISGFLILKSQINREEGNLKLEVVEEYKTKTSRVKIGEF